MSTEQEPSSSPEPPDAVSRSDSDWSLGDRAGNSGNDPHCIQIPAPPQISREDAKEQLWHTAAEVEDSSPEGYARAEQERVALKTLQKAERLRVEAEKVIDQGLGASEWHLRQVNRAFNALQQPLEEEWLRMYVRAFDLFHRQLEEHHHLAWELTPRDLWRGTFRRDPFGFHQVGEHLLPKIGPGGDLPEAADIVNDLLQNEPLRRWLFEHLTLDPDGEEGKLTRKMLRELLGDPRRLVEQLPPELQAEPEVLDYRRSLQQP